MPRGVPKPTPPDSFTAKTRELMRCARDVDLTRAAAAKAAQKWRDAEAAYRAALADLTSERRVA